MVNIAGESVIAFWNNSPSIIKIILFLIIWAVIWLPIAIPLARLVKWQIAAPISNTQKLTFIISLYSLLPILTWALLAVEEIPIVKIGLIFQDSFFKSILFGYGLGILSILLVDGVQLLAGWLKFQPPDDNTPNIWANLPLLLLISLFISSMEELVFRGILVHFLEVDFSWLWTAIVSSVIFALLHLIWEQKNTFPQLPGLFLMGLVLFYARILNDNTIALSIGLHGGWVFILASVDTFNLYTYNPEVKGWLIGKKDQPLGSVAGLMVLLITTLLLLNISVIF
jgi:membrane protease YdiL (CAAX protease family)